MRNYFRPIGVPPTEPLALQAWLVRLQDELRGNLTSPLTQFTVYAVSLTPTTIATASVQEISFTVTGLTTTDKVLVNHPVVSNNVVPVSWRTVTANVLYGAFVNCSTATSSKAAAGVYKIIAFRS